jgi:hypothetical protein
LAQLESNLDNLMSKAAVQLEQVAAFTISPPCETYTAVDATNAFRGCQYRNHKDPTRGPRSLESCTEPHHFEKRQKAITHDNMIETLIKVLLQHRKKHGYEIILENPVGSLGRRPFMQNVDWLGCTKRFKIDYCSYGYTYKKPTFIWTTLTEWEPTGQTGSGNCEQKCAGRVENEAGSKANGRKHKHTIAGGAERAVKSAKGKKKQLQLWSLPQELQQELMELIQKKQPDKEVIFDMFAGGESWRETVEEAGHTYVAVDIKHTI